MTRAEQVRALGWSIVLLGVTFSPVLHGRDDFPLSTYPMFSKPRPARVRLAQVVLQHPAGYTTIVSPSMLGSDEVMQAYRTVELAVRNRRTAELCQRVAERLGPAERDGTVIVRLAWFDPVGYWRDAPTPERVEELVRCQRDAAALRPQEDR